MSRRYYREFWVAERVATELNDSEQKGWFESLPPSHYLPAFNVKPGAELSKRSISRDQCHPKGQRMTGN